MAWLKTIFFTLIALFVTILFLLKPIAGVSPMALGSAADVATGLGSKIACSGRYITGLDEDQVMADLASYSPAYSLVDVEYDDKQKKAYANLLGLSPMSATFRDGIGCTLDIGDTKALDAVNVTAITASDETWPLGSALNDIDTDLQAKVAEIVAEDNAQGYQTRSLLVVKNGKLLSYATGEGFEQQTPHLGWSMGKSVTAMMVGNLIYQKQLELKENNLFEAWQQDDRREIDLESLLRMSSGLGFDETYAPGSDSTRMLFYTYSASDIAMQSPLVYAPGEHFSYSSGTTNLLSRLVYETLGGNLQQQMDYLYGQWFKPLNMARSTFEPDPSGVLVGSSYIYASAPDWAKLGQVMLNGGELNGTRFLSEDWVAKAQSPNVSKNDPRYGYQFWLNGGGDELRWEKLPEDAYSMSGNRSQIVMVIPSKEMVIVRLGWSAESYPTSDKLAKIVELVNL
ncbi:serine hydrolase domain-containing protein [Thalassotalea sp. PS06]|uniref:serine hydrolase domain-containing protein n=1 Tax=Thalassotalea sp. PS06 TaxID=2594005 RepID=UPI00116544B4|nr:serine hydrolase [Thalassotalea sp. PS06]QDP01442.1 serine hydrolase [Thalassotalea sp. PS06]